MGIIDFIGAPIVLLFIFGYAIYFHRKLNPFTRNYFFPALLAKLLGALGLALIYYLYYGRGDTFGYTNSAEVFNRAFFENNGTWLKMLCSSGGIESDTYKYMSQMGRYTSGPEFFMIKITALCGLISLNSYLGISFLFSALSFMGIWALFNTLVNRYPNLKNQLAIAILFIPSVAFWGSGLMKDTIILGCLCWIFSLSYEIVFNKRRSLSNFLILLVCCYVMFRVRAFMMVIFMIPLIYFLIKERQIQIQSKKLQYLTQLIVTLSIVGSVIYVWKFQKLLIDDFAQDVQVSANYLYRVSVIKGGSAYYLGQLDGSIESTLKLLPSAIWVTLYRPYLWEVRNIVMLLASIESFIFLLLTIKLVALKRWKIINQVNKDAFLQYCLIFCLSYAFVTGITSYNFGALVRYKTPILPFFLSAIFILGSKHESEKV